MGRNNSNNIDLVKIRRLLRETTRLAERASMTGSLQGGGKIAIRQYNAIREHLQDNNVIPEDLFQELDEDEATFDELGVVAGMLDSFLEEEEPGGDCDEPSMEEEGEGRRGRQGKRRGRWGWAAWVNSDAARFWTDPQSLRELQEVGELVREHLPELIKMRERMRHGERSAPPAAPAPPAPPAPPFESGWNTGAEPGLRAAGGWSSGTAQEAAVRMRQIAEELQRDDLEYGRRLELSQELAALANSQIF